MPVASYSAAASAGWKPTLALLSAATLVATYSLISVRPSPFHTNAVPASGVVTVASPISPQLPAALDWPSTNTRLIFVAWLPVSVAITVAGISVNNMHNTNRKAKSLFLIR